MGKIVIDDEALTKAFNRMLKEVPKQAAQALQDCIIDLAAESAMRAPIESGDLRNNCHGKIDGQTVFKDQEVVGMVTSDAPVLEGSVGYSLPYALRQHEDLALRHDRTDGRAYISKGVIRTVNMVAGGEAKFLERPFQERKGRYIKRFEKALEGGLK